MRIARISLVDERDIDLKEWVHRHRVTWESLPHREAVHGEIPYVGYDLVLSAACIGPGPWDPAGLECVEMFRRLQELAAHVVPAAGGEAVQTDAFEPMLHLRPATGFAPEIQLVITVRHDDHDYFDGVDAREMECLRRLESALQPWGVQHGTWRETPTAA
jgi:hypothetical protein